MPLPEPALFDASEKMKDFDSVPLFMRSLPEGEGDNDAVNALQALAYDGTPDEIATNFKERGNEYFKGKRMREAVGFYTQGIDAKPTDSALLEALLCNRAACNIDLQNYGSVLRDCSKALNLNSKSSKAYYRSAVALLALDRPEEGLDVCDRCLSFDPDNVGVKSIRERVAKATEIKRRKDAERAARKRAEEELKKRLQQAFHERHVISKDDSSSTSINEFNPHFASGDNPNIPEGILIISTFFLYPQHAQSDLISEFAETMTIGDQLVTMFPPEAPKPDWDTNDEYTYDKLNVYAITANKRLLKIGKKMTLRDVMNSARSTSGERDGMELRAGCMNLVVIPKGSVEQAWVKEFKSSRDRGQ